MVKSNLYFSLHFNNQSQMSDIDYLHILSMKSTNGVCSLQTNVDRQKEQQHEQGLGVVAEGDGVPVDGLGQGGVQDVEPHRRVPWLQRSTNISKDSLSRPSVMIF